MKCSISLVTLLVTGILAIPTPTTPTCKPDEQYNECGTACPLTCAQPSSLPCTLQCVSGCFCKAGTIRNLAGACVKPSNC